jgi:prohibitin 2
LLSVFLKPPTIANFDVYQVAQQESQRAKYIVEKAVQEKKSIVIRAEGEARSAELIGSSIKNNPGFIQLRRIEAAREIATVVNSSPNKMYLSADTLMLDLIGETDRAKRN